MTGHTVIKYNSPNRSDRPLCVEIEPVIDVVVRQAVREPVAFSYGEFSAEPIGVVPRFIAIVGGFTPDYLIVLWPDAARQKVRREKQVLLWSIPFL